MHSHSINFLAIAVNCFALYTLYRSWNKLSVPERWMLLGINGTCVAANLFVITLV